MAALLTTTVDPNQTSVANSTPPLMEAAIRGDAEIVGLLTSHPLIRLDAIDHVQTAQTALHKVSLKLNEAENVQERSRYVQCLKLILSGGKSVNVNAQDAFGNTALHYAALSGNFLPIFLLLKNLKN